MTNQAFLTISHIIITIGIIFTAIGGLGVYFFGHNIKKEENAKIAYTGNLEPEKKEVLSTNHNIYPKLEIGNSGAIFIYAGPNGSPFFKFADDNNLIIETENDQIKISIKIINEQGKLVAEIIKNEWKVNPNESWDRNYSKDAIEVKDASGDIILQVKLMADRVQFQAKLYNSDGTRIGFGKRLDSSGGGSIEFTGLNKPELEFKIHPIFKYPSDQHFGEMI